MSEMLTEMVPGQEDSSDLELLQVRGSACGSSGPEHTAVRQEQGLGDCCWKGLSPYRPVFSLIFSLIPVSTDKHCQCFGVFSFSLFPMVIFVSDVGEIPSCIRFCVSLCSLSMAAYSLATGPLCPACTQEPF